MKKGIIIFIMFFYSVCSYGQLINEPYSFPIKPGTKEWSNLKTEKERFTAMQIPEDLLPKLSTNAIIISCANFPAFGFFGAYDTYQTGFTILATKFNGLKELAKRKDSGECLLNIYEMAGENGIEDQQVMIDKKYWPVRFSWIELILAQKVIIESLNISEKKHLLLVSLEKFKLKQSSEELYPDGLLTTTLLMGRLLHSLNYIDFENEYNRNDNLSRFLNKSSSFDRSTMELILKQVQEYLQNN